MRTFIFWCCLFFSVPVLSEPLPALGVDPEGITTSGISSGGYMAGQMHVAYSDVFSGVGVIAAGPYGCAESESIWGYLTPMARNVSTALDVCMDPCKSWRWMPAFIVEWCEEVRSPDAAELVKTAADLAEEGLVAPLSNLENDRVYLFSGHRDRTVVTAVADRVAEFYQLSGVAPTAIKSVQLEEAAHAVISDNLAGRRPCDATEEPFINDCDGYDQARDLLAQLYGPLAPNAETLTGRLQSFSQKPFLEEEAFEPSSLADTGYLFIPQGCENGGCRLHVAFHGCRQSAIELARQTGDLADVRFRTDAGYTEVADSNKIVVLFPQIRDRELTQVSPFNPKGCWDWWGYSGDEYAARTGLQPRAIKAMVDRLLEAP